MSAIRIRLTQDEIERLLRPVSGQGGFQSLLRGLQEKLDRQNGEIEISEREQERIRKWTSGYGAGGFQDQLDVVVAHLPDESEDQTADEAKVSPPPFDFQSGLKIRADSATRSTTNAALELELRHNTPQEMLFESLAHEHGHDNVGTEIPNGAGGLIDVVVRRGEKYEFYELKAGMSPRECLREAIGQLLEYAYWPGAQVATRLVVVGEDELDAAGMTYLETLEREFGLRICYIRVNADNST